MILLEPMPYSRLARKWWSYSRRGLLGAGPRPRSVKKSDQADGIDDAVLALFGSILTFEQMLVAMATRASSENELMLIGARFLETAAEHLGGVEKVLSYVDDSPSLTTKQKSTIRSGVIGAD